MLTEENKAKARRFYEEVFNQRNVDAVDEFVAADFVDHNPGPEQAPGREGLKRSFARTITTFPDLHVTVEDMVTEGDKITTRVTFRGTHDGEFEGTPATGKPMTITGIDIVRIEDDKTVERWGNFDELGMLQQLGIIPLPGEGGG
ncbi:MAG: ester cyclase [Candidatus Bipolaricaulia bacterium]